MYLELDVVLGPKTQWHIRKTDLGRLSCIRPSCKIADQTGHILSGHDVKVCSLYCIRKQKMQHKGKWWIKNWELIMFLKRSLGTYCFTLFSTKAHWAHFLRDFLNTFLELTRNLHELTQKFREITQKFREVTQKFRY